MLVHDLAQDATFFSINKETEYNTYPTPAPQDHFKLVLSRGKYLVQELPCCLGFRFQLCILFQLPVTAHVAQAGDGPSTWSPSLTSKTRVEFLAHGFSLPKRSLSLILCLSNK